MVKIPTEGRINDSIWWKIRTELNRIFKISIIYFFYYTLEN